MMNEKYKTNLNEFKLNRNQIINYITRVYRFQKCTLLFLKDAFNRLAVSLNFKF